jgi:hypothetical protein
MFHAIGSFAIYFISALFLVGMAGSAVVVLFSFFDDFTQLFSKEEFEPIQGQPPRT